MNDPEPCVAKAYESGGQRKGVRDLRMVAKMADRLLSVVVPTVTAGACCPHDPYVQECRCHSATKSVWVKSCSLNCACQPVCSACYNSFVTC
jgi:hypothetical protein